MEEVKLLDFLSAYFNLEDLKTLCFRLDVDYDHLGGEGQIGKARELIRYLQKRGRLNELQTVLASERPAHYKQQLGNPQTAEISTKLASLTSEVPRYDRSKTSKVLKCLRTGLTNVLQ